MQYNVAKNELNTIASIINSISMEIVLRNLELSLKKHVLEVY